MKAVLFDLDDTLYPEIEFVHSGFRVVAQYLASLSNKGMHVLFERLCEILSQEGRGSVFDTLLQELGLFSRERVKLLLYLYRTHRPELKLYDEVPAVFDALRDRELRLGIITDGMASVQRNKINALGLDNLCDVIICSDEIGVECWKPSTMPFAIALELLDVVPENAVYVGDNVQKDFAGAKALGMHTIQFKGPKDRREITKYSQDPLFKPHKTLEIFKDIIKTLDEFHEKEI